jgi:hypothetical protein
MRTNLCCLANEVTFCGGNLALVYLKRAFRPPLALLRNHDGCRSNKSRDRCIGPTSMRMRRSSLSTVPGWVRADHMSLERNPNQILQLSLPRPKRALKSAKSKMFKFFQKIFLICGAFLNFLSGQLKTKDPPLCVCLYCQYRSALQPTSLRGLVPGDCSSAW